MFQEPLFRLYTLVLYLPTEEAILRSLQAGGISSGSSPPGALSS